MWNFCMQKQLFRFERLVVDRSRMVFKNLKYFSPLLKLYLKYIRFLEDDFSLFAENPFDALLAYLEQTSPHFYLVLSGDEVCGFFALEDIVGKNNDLYSAYVVTCFDKKYWGTFTKYAGRAFVDFCFNQLGLVKLKAFVYPQNYRVRGILNSCGFQKEALLKAETLKNGKEQSLEIYSVFNSQKILEEKCK